MIVLGAIGSILIVAILIFIVFAMMTTSANCQTPPSDPNRQTMIILADGCEVFTPQPLLAGEVYKLTFTGTYVFTYGVFTDNTDSADAVYHTQYTPNFRTPYKGLSVNGNRGSFDTWREDRSIHEYSCLFEGTGKRVPLCLNPPKGLGSGFLTVVIELQPSGTITERLSKEMAEAYRLQAEEIARQQEELRQKQSAAAKAAQEAQERLRLQNERDTLRQIALDNKVKELSDMVNHQRNFLDPYFRAEYTRQYSQELLSTHREKWNADYDAVHADSALMVALKTKAPEVLDWYEHRHEMILAAERAAIIPPASLPPAPLPSGPRKITASTLPYVEQAIRELFHFTELYDRTRHQVTVDGNTATHRPIMDRSTRVVAFYYDELARFGIVASTPEEAETKFFAACPPAAPSVYEELIQQLKNGEAVAPAALCDRLEDLHREKIILQARRRASVRDDNAAEREALDRRLADIRREATDLRGFLDSIHCPIEFKDSREPDRELSLEEQFIRLYEGKKRVIEFLQKEGDQPTVDNVEALYAQEQAKLFEESSASYT